MSEIENIRLAEISRDLFKLLDFTTNEKVLLKRLEQILSPKTSKLGDTKEEVESLEQRIIIFLFHMLNFIWK